MTIITNEIIRESSCEPEVQVLLQKFFYGQGLPPNNQLAIVAQYASMKTDVAVTRLTRLLAPPKTVIPNSCKICAWQVAESRCGNAVMLALPRVADTFGRKKGLTVWLRHETMGKNCDEFLRKKG